MAVLLVGAPATPGALVILILALLLVLELFVVDAAEVGVLQLDVLQF